MGRGSLPIAVLPACLEPADQRPRLAGLAWCGPRLRLVLEPRVVRPWRDYSPFGIACSASSSRILSRWLPAISATGIRWLRGFDTSAVTERLATAAAVTYRWPGSSCGAPPGKPLTFPVDDLRGGRLTFPTWSAHRGRVHYWEVWQRTPQLHRRFVACLRRAHRRCGLRCGQARRRHGPDSRLLRATTCTGWSTIAAGARDHFDYLTVHPYELLDDVDHGGEAMFMSVVPTLRKMLSAQDPKRAKVPIRSPNWGTGRQKDEHAQHQAVTVIKAYTLYGRGGGRIHWFEGQDGDSGPFGLLDGRGEEAPELCGSFPSHRGAL